ncbi:MAG TPA: flagellar basal body protein [Rhizomicrobium sp.]|nr:flagellar basal body protein [Rhizomicrobium sp.]
MNGALGIAVSGMDASATWMDTIASNVANMNDTSALPAGNAPYTGYQPVTVVMAPSASGGVTAQVEPMMPAYSSGYDPSAPLANSQGLVAVPNVDLATAVVSQTMALQSYKANADVFHAAEDMAKVTLDMMA